MATSIAFTTLQASKEIELKISIANEQYPLIEQWLSKHAVYKGVSEQNECYVTDPRKPWDESKGFKDSRETLRVRKEKKGDTFCYKYAHFDSVTQKRTHRDEYETKVENGEAILQIVAAMGYTHQTPISKTRTTYLVRDIFEVTFDEIKEVGKFIEIELKTPTDDVKAGIRLIENLLQEMGITEFIEYDRSYIHMIWNPGYNFGIKRNLLTE